MKNPSTNPTMEPLEPRLLLSGDLTISDAGGNLRITGDDNPNQIVVTRDGDTVTVTPQNGETINGVAGPADFTVTRSITARMGTGDDVLRIQSNASGAFEIQGGTGSLRIDMGDGDDSLFLEGVHAGMANVNVGQGNNMTFIQGNDPDGVGGVNDAQSVIARNLTVRSRGTGTDLVMLEGVDVGGNVNLSPADGADQINVDTYQGADVNFSTTLGNFSVMTNGRVGGNNAVLFDDTNAIGDITVDRSVNIRFGAAGVGNTSIVAVSAEAELLVGRNMSVNSGRTGNLNVTLTEVLGNGLSVRGGTGNNAVLVIDSLLGSLSVAGSGDTDAIVLDSLVGRLNIRTGNGEDTIQVLGVMADNVSVSTGGAHDELTIANGMTNATTDVTNAVRINLGSGDDLLTAANVSANAAQLNGGPGIDTINDDDPTINVNTSREIGFEIGVD